MKRSTGVAVKSATRALDILEMIGSAKSPPVYGEIRARLRIPNSSLYYLLNTLVQRGYLVQNGERGAYALGRAVAELAAQGDATHSWHALAPPLLEQITGALNETSHVAEQRGDDIELLLSRLGTQMLVPQLRAGQRAPLYSFSSGKIFLAGMSDEAIDAYLARVRFQRFTPHTITSPKVLWREIEQVRSRGIAYARDEHTLGITGISIGLKTSTRLLGTIGVAIPTARLSPKSDLAARSQLTAAAVHFLKATQAKRTLRTPEFAARSR